jgi:hypothetical protein
LSDNPSKCVVLEKAARYCPRIVNAEHLLESAVSIFANVSAKSEASKGFRTDAAKKCKAGCSSIRLALAQLNDCIASILDSKHGRLVGTVESEIRPLKCHV